MMRGETQPTYLPVSMIPIMPFWSASAKNCPTCAVAAAGRRSGRRAPPPSPHNSGRRCRNKPKGMQKRQ